MSANGNVQEREATPLLPRGEATDGNPNAESSTLETIAEEGVGHSKRWRGQCKYQNRNLRLAYMAGCVTALIWVILGIAGKLCAPRDYVPETCVLDMILVDVVRSAMVTACLFLENAQIASFAGTYAMVLTISKLWVFRGWDDWAAALVVILSNGASIMHASLGFMLDKPGAMQKVNWAVCRVIRPYFNPRAFTGKLLVLLLWILLIGSKVCQIYAPIALAATISALSGDTEEAVTQLTIFGCLSLATSWLNEARDLVYCFIWQRAHEESSYEVFVHIHGLPYEWHTKKHVGELVDAVNDGIEAADTLVYSFFVKLAPALWTGAAAFIVFVVHLKQPLLASIGCIGFGTYLWLTYVMTALKADQRDELMETVADRSNFLTDSVINYEAVKYFNTRESDARKYEHKVMTFGKTYMVTRLSHSWIDLSQTLTTNTTLYLTLLFTTYAITENFQQGNKRGEGHGMDIASFVAVQAYMIAIFAPLSELGEVYVSFIISLMNLEELSDILAEEAEDEGKELKFSRDMFEKDDLSEESTMSEAEKKKAGRAALKEMDAFYKKLQEQDASGELVKKKKKSEHGGQHRLLDLQLLRNKRERICRLVETTYVDENGIERTEASEVCSISQKALSLEFKNVTFTYPTKSEPALRNVSFFAQAGTTTAIVGGSGAGKSTIGRLLYRFYELDQPDDGKVRGEVLVGGYNTRFACINSLRGILGIVPQEAPLFNDTIYNNVCYGSESVLREQVMDAARRSQLTEVIEGLPDGWDSMIGERGTKLSGGEKQRISMARCILRDPMIVVLDEATSALDTKTEKNIHEAMEELAREGRTTIVVAHRLATIAHADQILVMKNGEIVERGTHEQLLAMPDSEYMSLWSAQNRRPTRFRENSLMVTSVKDV